MERLISNKEPAFQTVSAPFHGDPRQLVQKSFDPTRGLAFQVDWGRRAAFNNPMNEVTRILGEIQKGDLEAGSELLPLVYAELRRLAVRRMANERAGHTLQPTALVHDAYLRLVGPDGADQNWNGQAHFFGAAAEAMRRILIESARKKGRIKRGGEFDRVTWVESQIGDGSPGEELLAVNEALEKLEAEDPDLARLAKLRYFAGMTVPETAAALGISPRSVNRQWECARAWLYCEISGSE